jgi:hypothetical protein
VLRGRALLHVGRLVPALSALLALLTPALARADLSSDAERVVKMWSARGARVTRLPPVFLDHGRVHAVRLAGEKAEGAAAVEGGKKRSGKRDKGAEVLKEGAKKGSTSKKGSGGSEKGSSACLTVLLLAPRTAEFLVDPEEEARGLDALDQVLNRNLPRSHPPVGDLGGSDDRRLRSAAGAMLLSRCGADRLGLKRLLVELSSTRSALEVIVAEWKDREKVVALGEMLPERASGPVAPRGNPGRPLEPGPLPERLARAEKRARADGAEAVTRVSMKASPNGNGEFALRLTEGCHRLEVMAEVPQMVPRRATDIDAEARESESERLLARDRADMPDARLDFCLGEPGVVDVPFVGAAGAVNVMVSDARWPIPRTVPPHWGPRARGALAMALRKRGAPDPQSQAILETIGVQGDTSVPVAVEPGKCYLAGIGLVRGEARGIRIGVGLGSKVLRDETGDKMESAAVAFCADLETSAVIKVEARGSAPWWALVVWPM